MAEEIGKQIGKMFRNLRDKTAETVARQEAAFVRGKIAGSAVKDDEGNIIVDAGRTIDDAAIARAERLGKLHQLVLSITTAQVQDLKEKAGDYIGQTQEGQEARSLDSVEDYARARGYVGWIASMDVTDIRGKVVIPQGKEITEEDVRLAREANLLSALMSAARRREPAKPEASAAGEAPSYEAPTQQPTKRASIPLVDPSKMPGSKPKK